MDVDNQNSESVDQINSPRFSINVLQLLKSAQMQHGLRFGDYARYRRYCTARLRRLYKSLKFTHGRGKYSKRAITASMVTEVRYLHVVLYTAERAWSHTMEKKTLPDGPNARQRGYLIGRLQKAVKWATLFQDLCAIKGDSRTSLEVEFCSALEIGSDAAMDCGLRRFTLVNRYKPYACTLMRNMFYE
ncbi:signal recognition particle subunit SRP68-like [Coffea eugenioides]|uniref:signal recognition particle subunit SRP68-like n=1 Tax=Coffea eugenioides TaxID=49369 RepID=UPI000F614C46|nr:signal recognition particle subunit SRP68-like [Coffea eugenioides]